MPAVPHIASAGADRSRACDRIDPRFPQIRQASPDSLSVLERQCPHLGGAAPMVVIFSDASHCGRTKASGVPDLTPSNLVYVDGRIVPRAEAKVSVWDRGFQSGDAAYEGLRVYRGGVFQLH